MARMIDSAEAEPALATVAANNASAKTTEGRVVNFMMYSMFHVIAPRNSNDRALSRILSASRQPREFGHSAGGFTAESVPGT